MTSMDHRFHNRPGPPSQTPKDNTVRDRILAAGIVFAVLVTALRLGQLQITQAKFYRSLASGQRDIFAKLLPDRGEILVRENKSGSFYSVAANRDLFTVYSDNRKITDAAAEAKALAPVLLAASEAAEAAGDEPAPPIVLSTADSAAAAAEAKKKLDEKEQDLLKRLSVAADPYEPLYRGADQALVDKVRALNFPNIAYAPERSRFYPEKDFGGHLLGFVGYQGNEKVGRYGIEGYWDKELAGTQGFLTAERDPSGRVIPNGKQSIREKQDGSDVVLTVDRTLQTYACTKLKAWVLRHGAEGGSVVMLDPATGAIMVMCGAPDFDPNAYNKAEKASDYNNPAIWSAYEPGSVMKVVTMAAALDTGAVTPNTTYNDTGEEKFGDKTIRNSDHQAHGVQSMVEVLDKSLNTGAIFAMRKTGIAKFREYLMAFGLGTRTGVELDTESSGNLSSLNQKGEINFASASFGQGITVTPLQLAAVYAAVANNGNLMKPYIVDEIVHPDGMRIKTQPRTVKQVVSDRTSALLTGMLVSVVKNGHGHRAAVPGYLVAGKTGTAQVAKADGTGYDENETIGTFAGFAPVSNPRFALVVRIDKPKDVEFAESSAAPLFGDIAAFALQYLEVPPDDLK